MKLIGKTPWRAPNLARELGADMREFGAETRYLHHDVHRRRIQAGSLLLKKLGEIPRKTAVSGAAPNKISIAALTGTPTA
jgi:hypothetical protein